MDWDVFISYASEDGNPFVDSLVKELKRKGIKVWYDKFILKVGDSLHKSIERGIAHSKYGIVVLSCNFFNKNWPQKELSCLVSKEIGKDDCILPVWLDLDHADVYKYSPLLADKHALKSNVGVEEIASKIYELIQPSFISSNEIDEVIDKLTELNKYYKKYILSSVYMRLDKLAGYYNEKAKSVDNAPENLIEEDDDAFEAYIDPILENIKRKYDIPDDVYEAYETIPSCYVNDVKKLINKWCNGKLTLEGCVELFVYLDEVRDFDYNYILFGVPNYLISSDDHIKLLNFFYSVGIRNMVDEHYDPTIVAKLFHEVYFRLLDV